jgi:hypothetical protein
MEKGKLFTNFIIILINSFYTNSFNSLSVMFASALANSSFISFISSLPFLSLSKVSNNFFISKSDAEDFFIKKC